MKRFLALLLVISLSIGLLCACDRVPQLYYGEYETLEATQETTDEAVDETTLPAETEGLIPSLEEGTDVLTFRYDEKYLDLYYEKLAQYKEHALNDSNMDALETLDPELEEILSYLQDQQTIAMVLYYCDMKDEEASQLYLDMTDMLTEVQEDTIETLRDIYYSDSVIKDEIFAEYTEEDIQAMLDYDSQVKEIEQRYSEIVVEYQAMSETQVQNDIGKLYSEMVANYNRLAQIYGYDNYYDYAYERVNSRDYTGEEIALMRTYAKNYLLPAFIKASASFQASYYSLSEKESERFVEFVYADYDDADYLEEYFEELPEDVRGDMETLFDGNVVFPDSFDAMPGAFTTLIDGNPFCFFSKDVRDTCTVVHEMGHYYGALHGDLDEMPLDLAEVQSQAHEWLMIGCMDSELRTNAYECYLDYRMTNDIATILICVIVDEFEEKVYSSEGVGSFTTKDFDRIMEEVCEGYGGIEFVEANLTDVKNYWRLVALEHPIYYISYAVSLVPSLDMFFVADDDWDEGLEIYLGLTRDIEEEPTFLGALEDAGLASPFDPDVYEAIADRYGVYVEGLED